MPVATEGRDETIIAIFGVHRLDGFLEPGQRLDRTALEEIGIVDLESCRQMIDEEQPGKRGFAFSNR